MFIILSTNGLATTAGHALDISGDLEVGYLESLPILDTLRC